MVKRYKKSNDILLASLRNSIKMAEGGHAEKSANEKNATSDGQTDPDRLRIRDS
jgi:hypothetical protein